MSYCRRFEGLGLYGVLCNIGVFGFLGDSENAEVFRGFRGTWLGLSGVLTYSCTVQYRSL